MPFFVSIDFCFVTCPDTALSFAPWPWEKEICGSIIFEISWICGRAESRFSSELGWGGLMVFPSPNRLPKHLERIDPRLLHASLMNLRTLGTSQQSASEISRSGRVRWTLNRPVFTTAHLLLLSGWFWSQGWQFPRGKHKLQVVMSTRGQWGHTTLLREGRNPKGNPKLRTCKSPLLCGI